MTDQPDPRPLVEVLADLDLAVDNVTSDAYSSGPDLTQAHTLIVQTGRIGGRSTTR